MTLNLQTTAEEREELGRLEKAATPGEWIACLGSGGIMCTAILSYAADPMGRVLCDFLTDYMLKGNPPDHRPNMNFVISARNILPRLLADIEALVAENERLEKFRNELSDELRLSTQAMAKADAVINMLRTNP